jgi:TolB-like protein/Tfp pilus assembly protein PilF
MAAPNFFAELKRRNVYKVAVAYAVVGWLLIQIATTTFPVLDIPAWAIRLVIALVALGFPIALILAWAFELTPEGIKRSEDVSPGDAPRPRAGSKIIAGIVVAAAVAAGLLAYQLRSSRNAGRTDEPSIAVLPFENLSNDNANAHFASGVQDEILTRLAKIGALKVISRTSTQQYQSKPGNVRDIGQQLGVANLLQGSVQKAGDVVRVSVQLVRTASDETIWAERYDRKLEDIFAVEAEVASAIAEALNAKLTGAEKTAVAARPTNNAAAYDAYLRGLDAQNQSFGPEKLAAASSAFAEAARLDPEFALAWAHGSIIDGLIYFQAFDRTGERLATSRRGAETAMRLAPESTEAWLAKGYFLYRCVGDYTAALVALEEAGKRSPGDPEVLAARGAVERRRGNHAKSIELTERSLERDPRNVGTLTTLGDTLLVTGRPADARKWYEHALSVHPADTSIQALIAQSHIYEGNLDAAGRLLDPLPPQFSTAATFAIQIEYWQLRRGWPWLINSIQTVLNAPGFELNGWVSGLYPALAWAQHWSGDENAARQTFTEGRAKLGALKAKLGDNGYLTASLSSLAAGLGDSDAAVREAEEAVKVGGGDSYVRALLVLNVARTQVLCGRKDDALATLARISAEPISLVHVGTLRYGIEWDNLRADPRFQKLLVDVEATMNAKTPK